MEIKELVKKHFNLVDAPTEESFATIKTADGELELKYEGEELAEGLALFVVTADGDVAAPDGEHMLEGGITVVTKDGKIESILESAPAEEEVVEVASEEHEEEKMEEDVEEAMEEEKEMAEHDEEKMEEEVSIKEEVVEAVISEIAEVVTEKMKEYEEKLRAMEEKYAAFAKSPATSKTTAMKEFSKTRKNEELVSKNQAMIDSLIAKKRKN